MIDNLEIDALMESTAVVVREYVTLEIGKLTDTIVARVMLDVERRIKEIPAGPKGEAGKDAEPVAAAEVVAEVLARIPAPRDGEPGKDADPEVIRVLVLAEVERAVAAIPKPKDGEPGRPGKDAEPIHPDSISLMVVREVEKAVAAIPKSRDGRDGIDGRDALQIDILPGIDPAKSYPRGTWAKHFGGLARSTGSGWETVIAGLAAVDVIQGDDFRTFTIKAQLTGADQVVATFSMPVLIYREIFKDGTEYARGDVVTWAGAAWHCQADSTRAKPSDGPEWRLMVKRGDHGKDGTDGKPGARGPEGPKGRDGR